MTPWAIGTSFFFNRNILLRTQNTVYPISLVSRPSREGLPISIQCVENRPSFEAHLASGVAIDMEKP